jgi:hypothetical protein
VLSEEVKENEVEDGVIQSVPAMPLTFGEIEANSVWNSTLVRWQGYVLVGGMLMTGM